MCKDVADDLQHHSQDRSDDSDTLPALMYNVLCSHETRVQDASI